MCQYFQISIKFFCCCCFYKNREITREDHADVSADDKVEEGVYEHQPAQPTEGCRVSIDG